MILCNYICYILTSCVRISHFFPTRVTSLISVEFESLASLFAEKITEDVRHVYRFCTHIFIIEIGKLEEISTS